MASIRNHTSIIGPKNFPMAWVPNCCMKNSTVRMPMAIMTTGISWFNVSSPSTDERIVSEGVMTPSASRAAPPIMANP